MKKEITLEERKAIQLEMLSEIDSFCNIHGIKYSLAYGTLLGAIRHKGYIPWDDDMDIMMPLPDLMRFKEIFKSERLEYCDIDTVAQYDDAFSHVAYKPSYRKIGLNSRSFGINIDLYPVAAFPDNDEEIDELLHKADVALTKRRRYINFKYIYILRLWPFKKMPPLPYYETIVRDYRSILLETIPYGTTNHYWVAAGPIRKDLFLYDFDLFKNTIKVPFENIMVCSIEEYDKFLTLRYGDYMTPPPDNMRVPYHTAHYYWK